MVVTSTACDDRTEVPRYEYNAREKREPASNCLCVLCELRVQRVYGNLNATYSPE